MGAFLNEIGKVSSRQHRLNSVQVYFFTAFICHAFTLRISNIITITIMYPLSSPVLFCCFSVISLLEHRLQAPRDWPPRIDPDGATDLASLAPDSP